MGRFVHGNIGEEQHKCHRIVSGIKLNFVYCRHALHCVPFYHIKTKSGETHKSKTESI